MLKNILSIPAFQSISHENTIVVPVLNVYGTGAYLQEKLPKVLVTDGCIYVSANIKQAGVLLQHGEILRVFFGVREKEDLKKLNGQLDGEYKAERLLKKIAQDFKDSGIDGILSDNIKRDALTKFSYVSPIGTAGLYLHTVAGDFQREGEARELFKTLIREIVTLANAMGITFEEDLVERNLKILSNLPEEATTSMQRDVIEGKQSEIDGLVYEVVRMAKNLAAVVSFFDMFLGVVPGASRIGHEDRQYEPGAQAADQQSDHSCHSEYQTGEDRCDDG